MRNINMFLILSSVFIFGCAQGYESNKVQHRYDIFVNDVDGKPLDGVKIEYTLKDRDTVVESDTFTTPKSGDFRVWVMATPYPFSSNSRQYKTEIEYEASKEGYYTKKGRMFLSNVDKMLDREPVKQEEITLVRPSDFFTDEFKSLETDTELNERLLEFIDLVILRGLVAGAALESHSVGLISFKGDDYLKFKFTSINVYNSLQLDKYDIGKKLFDEVIRKVLTPLNDHIGDSEYFYGYDLKVIAYTKSFIDKYAKPKSIEYRFMIPEAVVEKYKNKDISGQQLLEYSIILMDDERIELKLQ